MTNLLIGCSGWSYGDKSEKGGWIGSFYPNTTVKKLPYYAQCFSTAEHDATYYDKFYKYMTNTFENMVNSTPANFQCSIKVPETITREKKLSLSQGAFSAFEDFLERISPLKSAQKLGAILFQMSPHFTTDDFRNAESFLR